MSYYFVFGLLSVGIGGMLFLALSAVTDWPHYATWLVAWSAATLVLYGIDKGLARARGPRVPEAILHLLSAVGGFAGGWLGMLAFRHKSNMRRHPAIWAVLGLSTLGHAILLYVWLF
jgi:uncharacterized membrane protein YsdA (DUF1294 family)